MADEMITGGWTHSLSKVHGGIIMAMVVRSNLMAYNANRQLGMNNSAVSKNLEKLSSGFKINRAADDAAGLAVSEKMKAQIKGLEQASLNSQDGISLVQTAEGALTEVHDMLNRMTELATKSANGTIQDDVDREAIQNEVNKLNAEIDRISESTNFNGIKLLNGNLGNGPSASGKGINAYGISGTDVLDSTSNAEVKRVDKSVAVGNATNVAIKGEKVRVTIVNSKTGEKKDIDVTMSANATGTDKEKVAAQVAKDINNDSTLGGMFKATAHASDGTISFESIQGDSDWAITEIASDGTNLKASIGAVGSGKAVSQATAYTAASTVLAKKPSNTATAYAAGDTMVIGGKKFEVVAADGDKPTKSGYTAVTLGGGDADLAANLSKLTGLDITSTGTGELTIKEKASTSGGTSGAGLTLQIGESGDSYNQVTVSVGNMGSKGIGTNGLDVANQDSAKAAIDVIKTAINTVSSNRSELGALQNRLEHTINNLDVAAENMTNANSRIRDTDMAKQMMDYTKMNVLTQSAQAMLAQANQNPQSILQLLQ